MECKWYVYGSIIYITCSGLVIRMENIETVMQKQMNDIMTTSETTAKLYKGGSQR